MFLRWVVFVLVCIAARPLESFLAVVSIVLVLRGEVSLVAGAFVVGGVLYWLLRRFVPGFTQVVRAFSSYRRRWREFSHRTYQTWEQRQVDRHDFGVGSAQFESRRLDED